MQYIKYEGNISKIRKIDFSKKIKFLKNCYTNQKFTSCAPGDWFSGHENDFTTNFPLVDVSNYISKNRVQILTKNPKFHVYVVYSKKLFLKIYFSLKKFFQIVLQPSISPGILLYAPGTNLR